MRKIKNIRDMLIPKGRTIYFDEEAHKYTNELGFVYTSTTTVIGKYCPEEDFTEIAKACERIGKNPNHKDYEKYRGKSFKTILLEWETTTKVSCEFGTVKHNFLENAVKTSNKYTKNAKGFINGRIYTVDDIMIHHNYGRLSLKVFEASGVKDKYPKIYDVLVGLHNAGYYIYAEIGVYDDTYGISGLIDILCVNHKTNEFIIVDWKTNKAPIRFDSGYYKKKFNGLLDLDMWIPKDKIFRHPLSHLADSVGNHYTMQLSTYAYLVTTFGYKLRGLVLCHIRPLEQDFVPREQWQESIEIHPIQFLENDSKLMLDDFRMKNLDIQGKLQFN